MLSNISGAEAASNADTSLLYAGEQYDGSADMYYNRARYYDPSTGRFNRTDPYAGNTQDPQSLHKYLYCHNNPINAIDPTGETFFLLGFSLLSFLKVLLIGLLITLVVAGPPLLEIYTTTNAYLKIKTKGQWFARTTRVTSATKFFEVFENINKDGKKITFFEYYGHGFGDDIVWPEGRGTGLAIGKDSGIVVNNNTNDPGMTELRTKESLLKEVFDENAVIELEACYSAFGNNSIAHEFKRILPEATVYGYTGRGGIIPFFNLKETYASEGTQWIEVN